MSALAPRWFLIVNGVALLCLGGTLLVVRIRQEGPWFAARKLFGLTWALLCVAVGGLLLAMAAGAVDQPGQPRRAPERRHGPEFPTDR